jgi:hypothetical protein
MGSQAVQTAIDKRLLEATTLDEVCAASDVTTLFHSYRVVSIYGIKVVTCWPSNKGKVVAQWRAIRRLVEHNDSDQLAKLRDVKVYWASLEYRPAKILALHKAGVLRLPASPAEPLPWEVAE